jgi:Caspase domain
MTDHSSTLAIILGASEWPHAPGLSAPTSFKNSAAEMGQYLRSPEGLYLRSDNVLDLFDSSDPAPKLLSTIVAFLREKSLTVKSTSLILYYVGHGAFVGEDYLLAIQSTDADLMGASSLRIRDLSRAILRNTSGMRRYLVLDCCFAAAAYAAFQSAPLQVAIQRTQVELPPEGTALLCASGSRDPALAPKDETYTMFTGALLQVLKFGTMAGPPEFSFVDVGELATAYLRDKYADEAVRPEVHTPEKRKGDVALIPIFPNPTLRSDTTSRLFAVEKQLAQLVQNFRELQRNPPPSQVPQASSPSADEPLPLFTVLEVQKILKFGGDDGQKDAHLRRLQKMRANAIATEFWICAISADGPITKLALDGDYNPALDFRKDAGQIDVVAKYPVAIPPKKIVELTLEYDITDSFPQNVEYLGHEVQHQTERVVIEVEFGVRKCLSGAIHRKYAGSIFRTEITVERSESGSRLRAEITNLKIGEEYRLVWTW